MTTFAGPPAETEKGIGALTLGGLLAQTCAEHRDQDAVAARGSDGTVVRWTYEELWHEARRYARGFMAAGVGRGTRVGLLLPNRAEWLAAGFGVALCGGVLVPLSTWATAAELEQLLAHSGVALLVAQRGFARSPLEALALECPGLLDGPGVSVMSTRFPHLRRIYDVSGGDTRGACAPVTALLDAGDVVSDGVLDAAGASVTPADDAVIIYTSGTTELPKGVLHAHRSPALQSWRFASRQRLVAGDRVYSAFPFFWTAGFAMVMGATLAAGGCLCVAETFSAEEALRTIEDERVTIVHVWPHHAAQMRDCPRNAEFNVSTVRNDPARFRPGAGDREAVLGSSRAGYGMSETFTIVTSAPVDAGRDIVEGSHGFLLPGNVMRIIDPRTRQPLGAGQEGEILVKGTTLMRGYVGLPAEACFDVDGFFHSGDTGFVDERGLLHWTGRATELIKTGGANVSPVEVETVLAKHPGLLAAAVVGLADEMLGEVVVACVVSRPDAQVDEDGVRAFVREHLSSYKVPRRVLFFDSSELPVTSTDKVQHAELRRLAAARMASPAPETAPA